MSFYFDAVFVCLDFSVLDAPPDFSDLVGLSLVAAIAAIAALDPSFAA